jgi:hypothetical protein
MFDERLREEPPIAAQRGAAWSAVDVDLYWITRQHWQADH